MSLSRKIRKQWPRRPRHSHKGDYGRVLILAGSAGMHGAAHLAGMAALRSGAGLVTVAVPDKIYPVVARREAELMVLSLPSTQAGSVSTQAFRPLIQQLKNQDVFALGPGLSRQAGTVKLVRRLIQAVKCAVVLDADALNAFEGRPEALRVLKGHAVLTPHAGEFQRLFGTKPQKNSALRIQAARAAARKTGVVVVLKGARTVVAAPAGKFYVNTSGNPGMATAGTGDVLTGLLAAVLAQGFNFYDAACFAVFIHGLAGDLAAKVKGEISLTAGDVLDFLPAAFKKCGAGHR